MKNLILSSVSGSVLKDGSYLSIIGDASPISKLILLVLLIFSFISWAIIVFKFIEYSRASKNLTVFLRIFKKSKNLSDINKAASSQINNPLACIFRKGYYELNQLLNNSGEKSFSDIDMEILKRSLMQASGSEISRLERLNSFLATTASVTPFIGLLGTVWGIMSSFHDIGSHGNANLTTVAPGIAEALIATALGLFAAIPAVICYNFLLNKLKVIISQMDNFILEFLNISQKIK